MQYRQRRENHVRQLILILITAGLIAYDLFILNGLYLRALLKQSAAVWAPIEKFLLSLF
jgi:hypothetical protein